MRCRLLLPLLRLQHPQAQSSPCEAVRELVVISMQSEVAVVGMAAAAPNPSVEARPNGKSPGPVWRYAVHCRQPGPGALPPVPPHLER